MKPLKVALLSYQVDQQAPVLVAKGQGLMAERILQVAHEHNIPIQQQPDLVQYLSKLDLNEQIPPTLYAAVAVVLALAWTCDREKNAQSPLWNEPLKPNKLP